MAQQVAERTEKERYIAAFRALERDGFAGDPTWVRELRRAAIARFDHLGFPIARRGNEEWKYTDIRPLARAPLETVVAGRPAQVSRRDLEPFTFGEARWHRIVFVNWAYSPELSSLRSLPAGVSVMSLAEAMMAKADVLEKHLGKHVPFQENPFVALNTAFVHQGALVHVPAGAVVEQPVHILFLYTTEARDTASHPRVLIVTERGSQATIIQTYGALADVRYFTNAVTEAVIGPGAVVRHYTLQRQSHQAYHIHNCHVVHLRDCNFSSVNIDLGGGLVRNNLYAQMAEEGPSALLNGLYMVTGTQHVDNQVIIDNEKGHTTANELYKGVLDQKARSVFHGSIIVRPGAAKVNAQQEDKNLLLSKEAEADTKPAFWIYCDDVKCGHGAACGQLDENALYYLRSRGLDEKTARVFLIRGFVREIIDSIAYGPLRDHVDDLVQDTLSQWLAQKG